MDKTLIYLATPYSHSDWVVQVKRFNAVNWVAAQLMRQGLHIFSPISHTHPIALAGGLRGDRAFWQAYDKAILAACKKVIVLKQPGWEVSTGVSAEIQLAKDMGIPVEYMDYP